MEEMTMTLDHVAKVGSLIFPVKREASDGSLILALPNGGMYPVLPPRPGAAPPRRGKGQAH